MLMKIILNKQIVSNSLKQFKPALERGCKIGILFKAANTCLFSLRDFYRFFKILHHSSNPYSYLIVRRLTPLSL